MALRATIHKVELHLADADRNYYASHSLTIAKHPSETDERMMVRLIALALQAHQIQTVCQGDGMIAFGAGLSDAQEPDVSLRDFSDQIQYLFSIFLQAMMLQNTVDELMVRPES
jgi:uncharacterized protein YaeQ